MIAKIQRKINIPGVLSPQQNRNLVVSKRVANTFLFLPVYQEIRCFSDALALVFALPL
jgi:hypothetical protein